MVFGIKKGAKKLRERNRMIRNIFISTDLVQYGFGCMNDFQWINRYCLLIVFPFHRKIGICLSIIFRWFRKRFTIDITEKNYFFLFGITESITKAKLIVTKQLNIFENANFSLCVFYFLPLIVSFIYWTQHSKLSWKYLKKRHREQKSTNSVPKNEFNWCA